MSDFDFTGNSPITFSRADMSDAEWTDAVVAISKANIPYHTKDEILRELLRIRQFATLAVTNSNWHTNC